MVINIKLLIIIKYKDREGTATPSEINASTTCTRWTYEYMGINFLIFIIVKTFLIDIRKVGDILSNFGIPKM